MFEAGQDAEARILHKRSLAGLLGVWGVAVSALVVSAMNAG
jgi:hypothetical protein